jgi:hypothetical protein
MRKLFRQTFFLKPFQAASVGGLDCFADGPFGAKRQDNFGHKRFPVLMQGFKQNFYDLMVIAG